MNANHPHSIKKTNFIPKSLCKRITIVKLTFFNQNNPGNLNKAQLFCLDDTDNHHISKRGLPVINYALNNLLILAFERLLL
jgi:hypothetical protein